MQKWGKTEAVLYNSVTTEPWKSVPSGKVDKTIKFTCDPGTDLG